MTENFGDARRRLGELRLNSEEWRRRQREGLWAPPAPPPPPDRPRRRIEVPGRPQDNGSAPSVGAVLSFVTAAEHAAMVDAAPRPTWLARPVWPSDAYGVLGAADKAGKTWTVHDLAVSAASGTPWLGVFPVDEAGPVTLFLGEGGARKMLRRLRAICASRALRYEDLPIRLCFRVPHLTAALQLEEMREELAGHPAKLVVVDPLYLAARGAQGSQLYDMGAHLENLQNIVQAFGAALTLTHHWNQSGKGTGRERFSGAGPAEWGRVLVSVAVKHTHTDKATRATSVTLDLSFIGDEIPDTDVRIRRRVWADDPDDLASPMHYEIEELQVTEETPNDQRVSGLRPAARRVLRALEASEDWLDVHSIGDAVAGDDTGLGGLKARTIQDAAKALVDAQVVTMAEIPGTNARKWRAQPRAQHLDVRNPLEEDGGNGF